MELIVFTDLDGTLLDDSYSFTPARSALDELEKRGVPLVFCSSKTRGEIEVIRKKAGNRDPFVSENGGGVFIPHGYFAEPCPLKGACDEEDDYTVLRLGMPYAAVRKGIRSLRSRGFEVRGFGDMRYDEIMALTGLNAEGTAFAGEREFDEPFVFSGGMRDAERLAAAARSEGLRVTSGKLFHLHGPTDKGNGMKILAELFRKYRGEIVTAALGDGPTDRPMLAVADYPMAVPRPDGAVDPALAGFPAAQRPGPEGWSAAVFDLLGKVDP